MKYSSRFFLFAPVCLFLAFMAAVCVHWWIMADALSARLDAANGHEIAPGVTLRFATKRISGFPFSLDTVFRDVSFEIAKPHGAIVWRSENFAMHALTYGRDQTIFEAAGKQELDWTRADGSMRILPFAVGSLHASAISDKTGVARFDLDLVGFGSRDFTAQRLQFHMKRSNPQTVDVAATADLPFPSLKSCAHTPIDRLQMLGSLNRANSFDQTRSGHERWYEGLERWRLSDGRLDVTKDTDEVCGFTLSDHGQYRLNARHRLVSALPQASDGAAAKPDYDALLRESGGYGQVETIVVTKSPLDFSRLGPLY